MIEHEEKRIVVEIFSHEEADRLRAEMKQMDELHKHRVERLEQRLTALHNTFYEFMEASRDLRGKR